MGGPISTAKLTTLKTIPILTPALFGSVVKLVNAAGNNDMKPAANKP